MTIAAAALVLVLVPATAAPCRGGADVALKEASAAEAFLKQDPSIRLAPYLYLFIAHRQRCAFEAFDAAKNIPGMTAAAKKYRAFMQRARAQADGPFARRADDLDKLPFVLVRTDKHPRDFDPDT